LGSADAAPSSQDRNSLFGEFVVNDPLIEAKAAPAPTCRLCLACGHQLSRFNRGRRCFAHWRPFAKGGE